MKIIDLKTLKTMKILCLLEMVLPSLEPLRIILRNLVFFKTAEPFQFAKGKKRTIRSCQNPF